jgi:multidrug efflux pump subunit AcrA (membrane-fusion protein)
MCGSVGRKPTLKVKRALLAAVIIGVPAFTATAINRKSSSGVHAQWVPATYKSITRYVHFNGLIFPKNRVVVTPALTGRITHVHVAEGQVVRRGAPLFEIEADEQQYQVDRRHLELLKVFARQNREPAQSAAERKSLELDRLSAELELSRARRQLAATLVHAPIDGTIVPCGLHEGEMAAPNPSGSQNVVMGDSSRSVVQVEGDEFDIFGVNTGQSARIMIESLRAAPVLGVVTQRPALRRLSASVLSPSSYGFEVELLDHVNVHYGASATVEIEQASKANVLAVPLSAVISTGEGDWLIVKAASGSAPRRVRLGVSDDDFGEVLSGVAAGEAVAVADARSLQQFLRIGG